MNTMNQVKAKWHQVKSKFYHKIESYPDWGWTEQQKNKKFKELLIERLFWFPKVFCETQEEDGEIIYTKVTVESYATVTLVAVTSLDYTYYGRSSSYGGKRIGNELTSKQLALFDVVGQILAVS